MQRRAFLTSALSAAAILATGGEGAESATAFPPPTLTPTSTQSAAPAVSFLAPAEPGYEAAREVFNASITLRPAIIARCTTEAGVAEAIARASKDNLPVAIKSGGHSFEGFCLNEGGLVVDLSGMKRRSLDRKSGEFTAEPGCLIKEVNDFLLPRGRLLPAGSCGKVGLGGLTLGGGYGFFARRFGLTCDHLLSVRLVDGEGRIRDSRDEPELLWACRGGGNGHFGVVTEMRYRTQRAPARFTAHRFHAYKLEPPQSCDIAELWFEVAASLPEEAFSALVLSAHSAFILVTCHGKAEPASLHPAIQTFEAVMPVVDRVSDRPLMQALPSYYAEQKPSFFKNGSGGFYQGYDDLRALMPALIAELASAPGLLLQINTLGGAIARGEPSAYPHRALPFLGEWQSYWDKPSQAESRIAGAGRVRDLLTAAGINRHYANYPDTAFTDWPTAYYGAENYARLQKLKANLDPANRIQHPQSVR